MQGVLLQFLSIKKNLIFQGASAYKEKGDGLKEKISTSVLHFFFLRSVIY
jgi:hypothetical protein